MTDRGTTDQVLGVLRRNVGVFYCRPCAGSLAKISRREVQHIWPDLVSDKTIELTEAHCAECSNVRTVIRAKPARAEDRRRGGTGAGTS